MKCNGACYRCAVCKPLAHSTETLTSALPADTAKALAHAAEMPTFAGRDPHSSDGNGCGIIGSRPPELSRAATTPLMTSHADNVAGGISTVTTNQDGMKFRLPTKLSGRVLKNYSRRDRMQALFDGNGAPASCHDGGSPPSRSQRLVVLSRRFPILGDEACIQSQR